MPRAMRTHISQYRHNEIDQGAYMPTLEEIAEQKKIIWEKHLEDMRKSEHGRLANIADRRRSNNQAKRK